MCFFLLLQIFQFVKAKEIACERFGDYNLSPHPVESCFMDISTSINETDVEIIKCDNFNVDELNFNNNKNIFFLPIKVAKTFPNLINFRSASCSIKDISYENFKGLNKLKFLSLRENQIEMIPCNSFEDLVDLEELYLGKKVITFFDACHFCVRKFYCSR